MFDKMHDAYTLSWAVMIERYAIHGYNKDDLKLFDLVKHLRTNLDKITFVCVLLACNHAGPMDEGYKYFNSKSDSYYVILECIKSATKFNWYSLIWNNYVCFQLTFMSNANLLNPISTSSYRFYQKELYERADQL